MVNIHHTRAGLQAILSLVVSDISSPPGAVVIIGVLPGEPVILYTVKESPPVPGHVEGPGEREVTGVAPRPHLEAVGPAGCHVAPVGGPRLAVEAEVAR